MRKSTAKATRYAKLKDAMAVPQVLSDFDEKALGSRSHILSIDRDRLSRIPRLLRVCCDGTASPSAGARLDGESACHASTRYHARNDAAQHDTGSSIAQQRQRA